MPPETFSLWRDGLQVESCSLSHPPELWVVGLKSLPWFSSHGTGCHCSFHNKTALETTPPGRLPLLSSPLQGRRAVPREKGPQVTQAGPTASAVSAETEGERGRGGSGSTSGVVPFSPLFTGLF